MIAKANGTDAGCEATALSRTLASTETLQIAEFHLLDAFCTPMEERFERITRIGNQALQLPVVAITTVTHEIQWFKSVVGWDIAKLPVAKSLCSRAIEKAQPVVVSDLRQHLRYANHPLVTGPPQFRFYGAVPLRNGRGAVIGTFCVMDFKPRKMTKAHYQVLLDLAELAQREMLTNVLRSAQSALIGKLSIARRQALLDPLTKTWNRRGGTLLLKESIETAQAAGHNLAVLAVDVNHFKAINDRFGHPVGDRALQMIAKELSRCVRDSDGVCRFGGDEFLVIMSDVSTAGVAKVVKRVRQQISANTVHVGEKQCARVSVSIGTAWVPADHTMTADELVETADAALYELKRDHHSEANT